MSDIRDTVYIKIKLLLVKRYTLLWIFDIFDWSVGITYLIVPRTKNFFI